MVRWSTQTMPNNGWVARDDVPDELVRKLTQILADMTNDPLGRQVLQHMLASDFEPANGATFNPVRQFLRRVNDTVRPVALP